MQEKLDSEEPSHTGMWIARFVLGIFLLVTIFFANSMEFAGNRALHTSVRRVTVDFAFKYP